MVRGRDAKRWFQKLEDDRFTFSAVDPF